MKKNKILKYILIIFIIIVLVLAFLIFTQKFNKINANNIENESNLNSESSKLEYELLQVSRLPSSYKAGIPIYMYHYVRDDTGDYEYPENMVKVAEMEKQLKYISENGFDSIYLTDLDHVYQYEKPVAITYDDGFICVYLYAFPLLKKYNVKSTIFVIKDLIGTPGYCTVEQLHEMQDSGIVDIQIHTVTHPRLATLNEEKIRSEISECKKYIEEEFKKEATILCYPYGSYNSTVIRVAKELGCTYGLAMTGGMYYTNVHKDKFAVPRIYANRSMTINEYINYLNKSYVDVKW